jgi:hypothetical protein
MDTEASAKWQPVMVYVCGGGRLECQCGALAVVVVVRLNNDEGLTDVDNWCQTCYLKAQQEEMEETF